MKITDSNVTYEVPQIEYQLVEDLARGCAISPLLARILLGRGISDIEDAKRFLSPSLERDLHDPACIPGLLDVADEVEKALRLGKQIVVFGDFDVDGVTATTVSVRGLRALGAKVEGLIPHRYDEGYALSAAAIERAMQFNPELIMTVDCGISCAQEVAELKRRGIDVVITDHHEPGECVPCDVAIADPKLIDDCPSGDLAGVGVALKLIQVLGARFGKPDLWRELTEFAALGTIADLMNLSSENRAIAKDGIERIARGCRPCLNELAAACGFKSEDITSTRLSFSLIPRLNAAGRMGDATISFNLLMADDLPTASKAAAALETINNERREAEGVLLELVEEQLRGSFADEEVIVASGPGWHEGVKGIVASRIAKKYHRPTIIFSEEDGIARGSGRSFGDINLFEVVSACSGLFEKFGGHRAAVGITMPVENIAQLRTCLCEHVRALGLESTVCALKVDASVKLEECNVASFQDIDLLEPFGHTNPIPLLVAPGVFMQRRSAVGKSGNHLRYFASDGISEVAGIAFGVDDIEQALNYENVCDIVFEPSVDEWRGRYSAKLMTRHVVTYGTEPSIDSSTKQPDGKSDDFLCRANDYTEELLSRQVEICDTGDYAGIAQAERFNTKVVGVTFENRQDALRDLESGVELVLVRQPDNEFDANAIAVCLCDGPQLGFLNRHLCARLAPIMDAGKGYDAYVSAVTGGNHVIEEHGRSAGALGVRDPGVVDRNLGVNIVVRKTDAVSEEKTAEQLALDFAAEKKRWRRLDSARLDDELREALIGARPLHAAQAQTLDHLRAGLSTLTVMATGRGKSLIFHLHAARMALQEDKASIFIYPLRALVADQAFHLQETYARFGLVVRVITGETAQLERDEIYAGVSNGSIDVLLTTPEFLQIHAQRFAQTGRIGFIVVDEAHHVGQAKAGNRPAYIGLRDALETLENPLVLAVTATAGDEQARAICTILGIEEIVLDETVRANLHIDDRRDLRTRENYLATIVGEGGKCIIYVNSRDQSMSLTRMLRKKLPQLAPRISFYNAGLPKSDRKRIEEMFRSGELVTIVSTSAFGEGIDIPDVEHVVLYHMPFNDIEFNQMAGRVGRDGRDAYVHLLFSYGDSKINEKILSSSAPRRDELAALYRALRQYSAECAKQGVESFGITNSELASRARAIDSHVQMEESAVSTGIAVFRELGFLQTSGQSVARHICMAQSPAKMNLDDSVRYREGQEEIESFSRFKQWALSCTCEELLARFNRPILPSNPTDLIAR